MYLAGDGGRYAYICFDFDSSRGNAPYDAARLSHWLDELNITHLVCASGPTGDQQVWIGQAESAEADLVRTLPHLTAQLLPPPATTPLATRPPRSVRPPGTLHPPRGV